ncbi:hypothetical protein OKW22_000845, partial [Bacilli bacterium PM5-3]|nr:hypothetical protein [Bacilli bacterium PM5-3]
VEHGDNKTITYSADANHKIKSVTVDGVEVDKAANASSYTFTNVTANHTIAVEYEINTYKITTSVVNGTIDATATVEHGDNKTITYSADANHKIKSVTVDGVEVDKVANASSYTFTNVTANHTIVVEYEIKTYKVETYVINGTIDDHKEVNHGDKHTVNYKPNDNHELVSIKVNGVKQDHSKCTSSYTFESVEKNHKIVVEYKKSSTPSPKKPPKVGSGSLGYSMVAGIASIIGMMGYSRFRKEN